MKYIIESNDVIGYTPKYAMLFGDGYMIQPLEDLEELNSDYINEHYGSLQDEAYQRGLEDGKAQSERGCDGCRFDGTRCTACENCCNSHMNHWTAKDDEIKVGDEVDWAGDKFIVTRIFQPHNNAEECDGVNMDGCTYHDVLISGLTKTGRHVDITDMLKGALE